MLAFGVAVFFGWVVARTGPAFVESRERRREKADRPTARVVYLPPSSCRE